MINVFLNLHLKNLTIKILAFWLKNRSGFFLFIHNGDYRTRLLHKITLKFPARFPDKFFSRMFIFLILFSLFYWKNKKTPSAEKGALDYII